MQKSLGSSGEVPGNKVLNRLQGGFQERKVSGKVVTDSSYSIFLHKVA